MSDLGNSETKAILLKLVKNAAKPLSVKEATKNIPKLYALDEKGVVALLKELVNEGQISYWPISRKPSYWHRDLVSYANERLMGLLNKPGSRAQLRDLLAKELFGYPKSKVDKLVGQLVSKLASEGKIFVHPRGGKVRSTKYSLSPPDPTLYMTPAKNELVKVIKKLEKAGLSARDVYEALGTMVLSGKAREPIAQTAPSSQPQQKRDLGREILSVIPQVEPRAHEQALVYIPQIREAITASKEEFDRAILDLAKNERIFLHRHVHPGELSQDELSKMVKDSYGYVYMGVVLREKSDR